MIIEPIHEPNPLFRSLRITQSGGIAGRTASLEIGRDMCARVMNMLGEHHAFELDADTAQELLHALARLAERRPGAAPRRGADQFVYDIELTWGGDTYRVRSAGLGADEALHGVLFVAGPLLRRSPDDPMLQLHAEPATSAN